MEQKLSKLDNQKFQKTKLPYDQVLKKLDQIEDLYAELLGPREQWDENIKYNIGLTRLTIISNQTEKLDGLERQYESRNSLDND